MKISYDAEIDSLYIRLIDGKHQCRTVRLSEEVALNVGEGEKLVGIEVLAAKQTLGAGQVPAVALEGLAFSGVPRASGRRQGSHTVGLRRRKATTSSTNRNEGVSFHAIDNST